MGHRHPARPPHLLEPAHRAHDRRTRLCHPRRGWILRLGSPRPRPFLGLPGKLALALGQHLRHGPLPFHLRALSRQILSRPHRRRTSLRLVARRRARLQSLEPPWRPRCRQRFHSAVHSAARALCTLRHFRFIARPHASSRHPMVQLWRCFRFRFWLGLLHRSPGSHVELHGLGQRLHHRAGSRKSPAQLSARHDCRRRAHRFHLHSAARRHGLRRTLLRQLLHRRLGQRRPLHRRTRPCSEPYSPPPSLPADASADSACSTRSP